LDSPSTCKRNYKFEREYKKEPSRLEGSPIRALD
jgi:hypothetical protein